MRKNADYFKPYIEAKHAIICETKCDKLLTDYEKDKKVKEYEADINHLLRIQNNLVDKEIKKRQDEKDIRNYGYETLLAPLLLFIVLLSSCNTTYPVYAKNVFVNDSSVVLKSGFYTHHLHYWEVNGKRYRYAKFIPTTDSNYVFHK